MAKTAISELQQQIEEVRREAFAAGYAAAIRAIREVASRPPPNWGPSPSRGRASNSVAATQVRRPRLGARKGASKPRRAAAARPLRGANAQNVQEVLQAVAPRALQPAEIRKALQQKGVELAFTSIRHALGQLQAREAVEQVGDTRGWRHRGTTS